MTITSSQRTPLKHARTLVTVVAAGALLTLPAAGIAAKPAGAGKPGGAAKPAGKGKGCAKTRSVGYTLSGTLKAFTADDPATPASEATVTLTLTNANRHARLSGDIADQDAAKPGVQAKGFEYTVPATDAFKLRLNGYEGTDTPSLGDRVHVVGRIPLTKARCAPAGTSVADRYGAVDVRRVTIGDRDAD
jgi:hypothetical protein